MNVGSFTIIYQFLLSRISRKLALLGALSIVALSATAQDLTKYIPPDLRPKNDQDTSYIDPSNDHWSLRFYGSFRPNKFSIGNSSSSLKYQANNRFGLGIGVAVYPFILDLGINLVLDEDNVTNRLDMQGTMVLEQTRLDFVASSFKGFGTSNLATNEIFRNDIRSSTLAFAYQYFFSSKKVSLRSVYSGAQKQKKSAPAFSLGGFATYYRLRADSTVIPHEVQPEYNDHAYMNDYIEIGGGIVSTAGYLWVLPKDFYAFASIGMGFGAGYKHVDTDDFSYYPTNPFIYNLDFQLSVGYNGDKYYSLLSIGNKFYLSPLGYSNKHQTNALRVKLIFGLKMKGKDRG